jgi:hypothetical protein
VRILALPALERMRLALSLGARRNAFMRLMAGAAAIVGDSQGNQAERSTTEEAAASKPKNSDGTVDGE